MNETITFRLNGKPVRLRSDGGRMLLWVLRSELGLTGTKYGCGEGFCGSCTVIMDKEAVRSCQLPVEKAEGKEVMTIEGLAQGKNLHPIQEAFIKHNALECGYCTPGMILNALSLLWKKPQPTREEIIAAMEGNLCRCGQYSRILQAIHEAAGKMNRMTK